MNTNPENGINPNPFDNLSKSDLEHILEENSGILTDAQVIEIKARIARIDEIRQKELQEEIDSLIFEPDNVVQLEPAKTKVMALNPNQRRAGYVDIIILMLTTWITCLCGMAYVYFNIMG